MKSYMRLKTFSVLLIVTACSFLAEAAGPSGSGGGKGVVCKDNKGKTTVELLDLWEARKLYNYQIPTSNSSVNELIDGAIQKLKDTFDDRSTGESLPGTNETVMGSAAIPSKLQRTIQLFDKTKNWGAIHRQHGVSLNLTPDSYEIEVPSGNCSVQQLVTYVDSSPNEDASGQIFINQDLVDNMDHVNEAALYVHEAYYRMLREMYEEQNSVRVRRAVGYAFSGQKFMTALSLLSDPYLQCTADLYGKGFSRTIIDINRYKDGTSYQAIPEMTFGTPVIGFAYRSGWGGSKSLERLFSGTDSSSGLTETGNMNFEIEALNGSGPISFDRNFGSFVIDYRGDKIEAYAFPPNIRVDQLVLPDLSQGQKLKCKLVSK